MKELDWIFEEEEEVNTPQISYEYDDKVKKKYSLEKKYEIYIKSRMWGRTFYFKSNINKNL